MEQTQRDLDELLCNLLGDAGIYAVGGRVRDEILAEQGYRAPAYQHELDADYLVTGMPLDDLIAAL